MRPVNLINAVLSSLFLAIVYKILTIFFKYSDFCQFFIGFFALAVYQSQKTVFIGWLILKLSESKFLELFLLSVNEKNFVGKRSFLIVLDFVFVFCSYSVMSFVDCFSL